MNESIEQKWIRTGEAVTSIEKVILESNIIVFSPHFDDFLFMLGGYVNELCNAGLLGTKKFHIKILFSRSNYLARTGSGNADQSLDRIKLATGKRLLEDQGCLDELLGVFNYTYELVGENECFVRGKILEDSEMEFPHGMYEDFNEQDKQIFARMKDRIRQLSCREDTALVFPVAFKEHIDHFIVREAAIAVAAETVDAAKATFYFQEDKPYGGIATPAEQQRIYHFVRRHALTVKTFEFDPELMIHYAFKYYISQVEEVYKTGIRTRAKLLQELLATGRPCDQVYVFGKNSS
ncbi:MAG: hypothetical protein KF746_20650 [Chitinophagaceae bacterium]|nr:hypothetical protein [Chitinophagaceae bacterium]